MEANSVEIRNKIGELERQLDIIDTRQTEVYARIVGYYRSVKNWNKGKREEYKFRTPFNQFDESAILSHGTIDHIVPEEKEISDSQPELLLNTETGKTDETEMTYLFFRRTTCPNCPPMKEAVGKSDISGREVDVDTEEGLETAKEYGVFSAPTVIFLNSEKREVYRTDSPAHFTSFAENKKATV